MKTILPAPGPHDTDVAEAQVLIEEARARARRRRRRNALVMACAAALAAGTFAVVRDQSPSRPVLRPDTPRATTAAPAAGGWPRLFAAIETTGEGDGGLEIDDSATGKLVTAPSIHSVLNPSAVTATGPLGFMVAVPVGNTCSTSLYRLTLSQRGTTSGLTRVGPALPGEIWSLAASAGGKVIAYAMSGCNGGRYLGVLDVATGRTRQWADAGLSEDPAQDGLSMSANGRQLAFIYPSAEGRILVDEVRVLPTDAPAGTVSARSHLVLRPAGTTTQLTAAILSPDGTTVYACWQTGNRTKASARIVAYRTATGKPAGTIATFTATGLWPGSNNQAGCSSMALDPSGRFLLVQHALSPGNNHDLFRLARIDIATAALSAVTVSLSPSGGMDTVTGMQIAW